MTPRNEAYDARLREHLTILRGSRKTPQKKLAEALGDVHPCQVTRRLDGSTVIKPREVAALLDALGVDHGEFFGGVAGGFHAEVYLARIAGDHDRQKKYADTDLIADGPSRPYTADELREMAAGLRDLRIADPEAARVRALDILRTVYHFDVDPGVEARFEAALGLAAVYRVRGSSGTAAAFLLQALYTAGDHRRMRARMLLALVPLAADLGDFEAGLQAADLAISEFAQLGDLQGQGRVLISKGSLFGQNGQLHRAIDAYSVSLLLVAEDRWYQRFSALVGLGLCHMLNEDLPDALSYSDRSLAALDSERVPPLQEAEARWLRGEILLRMGSSEGIRELRIALDIRSKENASKLSLTLISLRLACAYYDHGQLEELGKLTAGLSPLLRSVAANNKLLQGSLAELIRRSYRAGAPPTGTGRSSSNPAKA
jgi:tetratricopeptide (TPR) repeat protein